MSNTQLERSVNGGKSDSTNGYVETDPSGRYGRFKEVLGKGAMKVVYKGFDEVRAIEVAWNQIKLCDVFRSPDEIQRLYSEVHILKSLHHDSIIKFHTSWIDIKRRNFNFITEMFTSGTLREYRQKYHRVDIRAVKDWARQILNGLSYLHGLDPPVIHRDIKCDNIFVNGHLGQVKIGDLGLAAMLHGSHHAHSVIGTPEFMAPELYEEDYDELVDIYSFGMCVLEMLTSEYPYKECKNPAQIYKKVTSGKLPEAMNRIEDPEARRFVQQCLENVSKRLPARELLLDPFLACEDENDKLLHDLEALEYEEEPSKVQVKRTMDISVTGTINPEDDSIILKFHIPKINGKKARNVFFVFDIENDTVINVAKEMVIELEIIDHWKPSEIAEMIEDQLSRLVTDWKSWSPPCLLGQDRNSCTNYDQEEEENDDEGEEDEVFCNGPFYASSSRSTSHNSLFALNSSNSLPGSHMNSIDRNWLEDHDQFMHDDTSSVSSFDYSNMNYYSANEDVEIEAGETQDSISGPHKTSRFRPSGESSTPRNPNYGSHQQRPRLPRIRSHLDVRSQLLHRSLVEELSKRRMFNTVGAVENIGYHELAEPF